MTARFSIVDEMPNKGAVAWKELVKALRFHWVVGTDTLLETPFYARVGKPTTPMDTIRKIQELAAYREQYIRKKRLPLSFKKTCYKIGISPGAVKWHAPELYENWNDLDFHWKFPGQFRTWKWKPSMPRKKGYKSKYPYTGTMERIFALAAYREQHMKERGKPPVWTAACTLMGVHLKTVFRHAPELAARWYDTDFHL
jgi:hypothetical protein